MECIIQVSLHILCAELNLSKLVAEKKHTKIFFILHVNKSRTCTTGLLYQDFSLGLIWSTNFAEYKKLTGL